MVKNILFANVLNRLQQKDAEILHGGSYLVFRNNVEGGGAIVSVMSHIKIQLPPALPPCHKNAMPYLCKFPPL